MLDENLPAFFLKPSPSGAPAHHHSFYLSHHGSDPSPAYTLQHADPASSSPAHKNCYAAALFDAYNPEVLYGDVLARPTWTQPTLSQEEVRRNGGLPTPPQPALPLEFTVQLYNPDQQIIVAVREGKWGASDCYDFSMPETTFRQPSASSLDRGQSDPASLASTPKINFVWRKESKLGKDLTCFMTGKSTDTAVKKRSQRDPDIAVALWRSLREMTIYEPNLSRIDIEDPKGFEVVLLLSAVVIKDLYFSGKEHMKELFNLGSDAGPRKLSAGGRKLSNPEQRLTILGAPNPLASHPTQQPPRTPNEVKLESLPKLQTTPQRPARGSSARPPSVADPRQQWELDAEAARLRAQAAAEAKQERQRRREREKADEAERKRLQKMVGEEERQARQKRTEVDRETERLRKLYGVQAIPQQQRPAQQPNSSRPRPPSQSYAAFLQPIPQGRLPAPRLGSNGLSLSGSHAAAKSSSQLLMSGANGNASSLSIHKPLKKKSFFGLRSLSDDGAEVGRRLSKKSSAMW